MKMSAVDFSKIKLVVWDLDDTFWRGTLSEGEIEPIADNVSLIGLLTDCGVVNTICSKNDSEPVKKQLEKIGVWDYFVFPSIDWTPKGQRIVALLKDMGLRAENTLFIDDNSINLNEALHYSPKLMCASPDIIPQISVYFKQQSKKDLEHKRLNQYKVLESKVKAKKSFSDNESFLYSINTKVLIEEKNLLDELDRIHELVLRSNQLNYTKIRSTKEELVKLIEDPFVRTGYVRVSDKFGDYGIVGFYALRDNTLEHFVFSCRAIGQGVEQYVYSYLGYPKLNVVEPVVSYVDDGKAPEWINNNDEVGDRIGSEPECCASDNIKILFKGPCDMALTCSYLERSANILTEFTYVGERHNSIEQHNHTLHVLQTKELSSEQKKRVIDECVFADPKMYDTAIFDKDVNAVFLSTLTDLGLGVYENKYTGVKVVFGEWNYDLTNCEIQKKIMSGEVYSALNKFTGEWLEWFSDNYVYKGRLKSEEILANLRLILRNMSESCYLILILGSEIPFLKNAQSAYDNRHEDHKALNVLLREFALKNKRVKIIDVNDFIKSQDDFTNNINHYSKRVYFEIAQKAKNIISETLHYEVRDKKGYQLFIDKLAYVTLKLINPNSKIYFVLKNIYHKIKR